MGHNYGIVILKVIIFWTYSWMGVGMGGPALSNESLTYYLTYSILIYKMTSLNVKL